MLALIEIHRILADMQNVKKTALQEESVIIRITLTHAELFFFLITASRTNPSATSIFGYALNFE